MRADQSPLDSVLPVLRCPVCGNRFARAGSSLACADGHLFDIARQGYVTLMARPAGGRRLDPGTGDTSAMVAARESFLAAGHYRPISDAIADAVHRALNPPPSRREDTDWVLSPREDTDHALSRSAPAPAPAHEPAPVPVPGIVLDLAGGTGQHLAVVLDRLPDRDGLVVDLSKPALQRAARVHPRAAAVGADAWGRLPLADGCAAAVLNVFGPRNAAEISRLLAPGGVLVSVTPTADHLRELIGPLGMLRVDARKEERLSASLPGFVRAERSDVGYSLHLDHAAAADLVGMGPSADHLDPTELSARIAALPSPMRVTVTVGVSTFVVDHRHE